MRLQSAHTRFGRAARRISVATLLILALAGCTQGTQGIFATIEVEEATDTSNLPDSVSPTALVYTNLSDAGGRYLVLANGRIWQRDGVDGSSWSSLATPDGRRAKFLAGLDTGAPAGVSNEVYAVFEDGSGNGTLLYALAAGGGGEGDLSWNAVSTTAWNPAAGERITGMRGVGNRLLASVDDPDASDPNRYELLSWAAGLTGAAVTHGEFRDDLRDAARSGGAVVAVGRGTRVAVVADVTATGINTASAEIGNAFGVGLIQDGGGSELFAVATLDGTVYVQTPGAVGSAFVQAGGSVDSRAFSDIARIETVSSQQLVAVGVLDPGGALSEVADGYREAVVTGTGTGVSLDYTNEIGDSYRGSDLARSGIGYLEYIAGSDTLFALTIGTGLWRTTYPGTGADPDWDWE